MIKNIKDINDNYFIKNEDNIKNLINGGSIQIFSKDKRRNVITFDLEIDSNCCGSYNLGSIIIDSSNLNFETEILELLDYFFNNLLICNYIGSQRSNIICTLVDQLIIEIFVKFGFKQLGSFINCKTGNEVFIFNYIIPHTFVYDEDFEEECIEEYND